MHLAKKKFNLLGASFILATKLIAQPYHVGDTISDPTFTGIFNCKLNSIKFSNFRKKLIILDFWDPSCISCLLAFSEMEALQKKYDDKIQILLINKESLDSTKNFFAKRKQIKIPGLPFITGDSLLNKWFIHSGEPFHVWIDSDRVVRYLIDGYNSTDERIAAFLNGKNPVIAEHKEVRYVKSLLSNQWANSVLYSSCLTHCIPGLHLEASAREAGYKRITLNCYSAIELYIFAFNEGSPYGFRRPGRLILQLKDSFQFFRPQNNNLYDDWEKKYSYNYQLVLSDSSHLDPYQLMREDLSRYFNLDAAIENRNVKCIVLTRIGSKNIIKSSGKPKEFRFYKFDLREPSPDSVRYVVNEPYRRFSDGLGRIIEENFQKPFLDSTGLEENIDISIPGKIIDNNDYEGLKKELRRDGLDLVERNCIIPILVIKEKCGRF